MTVDPRARRLASRSTSLARELGASVPAHLAPRDGTLAHTARALRQAGQYPSDEGTGPADVAEGASLDLQGLDAATRGGYLAGKYPRQRFAGGRYGDQGQALVEAEAVERAARLRGGRALVQAALRVQQAPGGIRTKGVETGAVPVPRLPEEYDRLELQAALERVAEGAATDLRGLKVAPPAPPAGTLDGAALRPGSVSADALDLKEVGRALLSWPGPDEAIDLDLAQSATMDRWVRRASTGVSGPGRIWTATANPGERARVGVGPTRYRLVKAGQRFGVMSCRFPPGILMLGNEKPGWRLQYGIVVSGIPHYLGQPPSRLLSLESVGDAPIALRTFLNQAQNAAIWPAPTPFFFGRAQSDHNGGTWPFGTTFGADANLAPDSGNLRDMLAFSVHLITGRDAGEVFRQLCSRQCLGRLLRMDGHGPALCLPGPQVTEAPTVPNVTDWEEPGPLYRTLDESADLTAANRRIVQGVPFNYDDCAALAPTDTHFSVVVMPLIAQSGEKLVSQLSSAPWATPEAWWQHGIKVLDSSAARLRTWALDIIVG